MSEIITGEFASNCLIQAIKHKIMDWRNVKVICIFRKHHLPHFAWSNGKYEYDFGAERHLGYLDAIWFKGYIYKHDLGWSEKYKTHI